MNSSSLKNDYNSKYLSKRIGVGQVNKLLKFSAWFLIFISAIVILFGILELIEGLLRWGEAWEGIRVYLGLAALLVAVPMFFASICALRYIYGKNNGRLTMCLFWAITPYVAYIVFMLMTLFSPEAVGMALLAFSPDILLIVGCYLEYKNGNCARIKL